MEKKKRITQRIDTYLDRVTEGFIASSIERYAPHDQMFAERIRLELIRRGELGKQLDIYEPARWVAMQTALSFVMGAAIKSFADRKFAVPALWTLAVSTVLMNSIQLVRLLPRYRAGLQGGLDIALKMQSASLPYDPFTAIKKLSSQERTGPPGASMAWSEVIASQRHGELKERER